MSSWQLEQLDIAGVLTGELTSEGDCLLQRFVRV
jgi:hypothetical protein